MGEVARINSKQAFSLTPRSLDEAIKYAEMISRSDIVPSDYKGKPSNILVAIQMGLELGLPPLQALQNIAVVNGRPAVWGDSLMAIARSHPACEYITEIFDDSTMTATCKAKRKGQPEEVRTFSRADAELAGLWGRNTWKQYPKRMLQMRARGFAVRDVFPDALRGIALAEEVQDIPERDMGQAERVEPSRQTEPAALPHYPADKFEANFGQWLNGVRDGKITVDALLAKVGSAYQLTSDQMEQVEALRDAEPLQGEIA